MSRVTDAPLRILLLEDSPLDAELASAALDEAGLSHAVTRVDTAEAFAAGLGTGPADGPDLILSDYLLPAFSGAAALRLARVSRPDVPFIFLSGALGEEVAIESLKDGATDYVLKQRMGRLGPAVRRAVREAGDRRGRAQVEDQYRFLADAIPQIVWTARPDGRIDYFNARWYEYTGSDPGAGVDPDADRWWDAVHPDDSAVVRDAWATARAACRPFEAEHRLRDRDGDYRYHLSRALPRLDAGGRVAQWVGTATDIDDRRRVLADYRALAARLDAILLNMNEGLLVADGAGNILSVNAAGLRLYGMADSSELRGPYRDQVDRIEFATVDGAPLPIDRWPLARVLAGETFTGYAVRVRRRATGRDWVASYAGTAVRAVDGRVGMAIVTFRDVTDQTRIAADLARAKQDADAAREVADQAREVAEAANRTKDEFLATLSHELRTPLNAILGWAQILRADADAGRADPAEVAAGLATVERNARVQAQLIEDLLDVSRIISGKLRLALRPIDLRPVLAAAADAVRPAAAAKRVDLRVPTDGPPVPVVGDPDRLQQVAWNLLANAVKFTPAGGTVRARLTRVADAVELAVADTGQGIGPDFLPYVFDRFRQADGTSSRTHGGLGLGLAIVRHLVELHGGTVRAQSDGLGRGATFRVRLPAAVPAEATTDAGPAETSGRPAPGLSLAGVRVVVVDDEPDARALAATVLGRHGAEVTAVATAAEALAAVATAGPAVLVSDIGMPGGDGYGLIAAVRRLPPTAGGRTPAVALTAYARGDDRDRVLAAGFDAFLPKPLDPNALLGSVVRLCRAEMR